MLDNQWRRLTRRASLASAYNSATIDPPEHTVAGIPLLETKLYAPKWRPSLVSRPRLIERKLTLISAPARSGKTTLLSEWMAAAQASGRPAAWISLDQSDNDPTLF